MSSNTGLIFIDQTPSESTKTRLIPLTEWPKHHSWPPLGGLRHLCFMAKSQNNGFDQVVKRVNRRVLIDETAFFKWVAAQNQ